MQKLLDGEDAKENNLQETWYIERYRAVMVDGLCEVKDKL
nr:MAG TPA: hypothetical protein [Caudoviricetes sp.]DAS41060.1 MAG TPA: hypothetical protein [Caudoviricetes sp.]